MGTKKAYALQLDGQNVTFVHQNDRLYRAFLCWKKKKIVSLSEKLGFSYYSPSAQSQKRIVLFTVSLALCEGL